MTSSCGGSINEMTFIVAPHPGQSKGATSYAPSRAQNGSMGSTKRVANREKPMSITLKTVVVLNTFCICALTIARSTPAAEADTVVFDLPEVGLSMKMPAGWQKGGVSGKTVLASFRAGKGLYPNLNVTLEDHGDKSLEDTHKSMLKLLPNAKVAAAKREEVNGLTVFISDVSWKSILGELQALRLITKVKGKTLVATFVAQKARLSNEAAKQYDSCLRSFQKIK